MPDHSQPYVLWDTSQPKAAPVVVEQADGPSLSKKYVGRGFSLDQRISFYTGEKTATGCVEWTGAVNTSGYASLRWEGPVKIVSRLVLAKKLGRPIRPGMLACHTCDNRKCVSEDHLYEGTTLQNKRDSIDRGTAFSPVGERHGASKLTAQQAREIYAAKGTHAEIASRYGVSRSLVGQIRTGVKWRSLHA